MQDLLTALHSVPMVPGSQDAFQEDRGVSDLCKTEKRLPDLSLGLAVRPSSSGMYTCYVRIRSQKEKSGISCYFVHQFPCLLNIVY